MIFFLFIGAQIFSSREKVPLHTISTIVRRRWKKAQRLGQPWLDRSVNISYAYFALCLLGAAAQDGVAVPLGAALALLPEDLGERAMLGDAGANALGAMLGGAATGLPRPARIALLAGIAALTAASEKVSFTKVIERTPALRWLDMLGRRPAHQAPPMVIPAQRSADLSFAGTARPADDTDATPPEE